MVVNYVITNPDGIKFISDFKILNKRPESGHMPIMFHIQIPQIPISKPVIDVGVTITIYKWNRNTWTNAFWIKVIFHNYGLKD